ncbi:MAG: site-specific DNA-methyltransferase [Gammaproteobacteria bacterium]|nr:MAG: site-specific DNA-methyltransferase [Gammaproteobacteria bacterium]
MKTNIVYNDDCVKILNSKIDKNSVDLIFADPPYNLSGNGLKWKGNKTGGDWYMVDEAWDKMTAPEFLKFTRQWIGACDRVLKSKGSIYIACSYHNISESMLVLKQLGFKINNIITWYKTNAMPNMTKRIFTHSTEFVIWAVKGSGWTFNYETLKDINPEKQKNGNKKQMRDFWQMPLVQGKERIRGEDGKAMHPTQKPEEMLKRIVLASSNEKDTVLDPFAGSGTTAYIAKKYNRRYIAIENSLEYLKIIENRLKK